MVRDKSSSAFDVSEGAKAPRYALTQFTTEEFTRFWPQLSDMLDRVPHTWRYWTKDFIYNSIMSNTSQVWGVGRPPKATLIIFTSISVTPSMRVLNVTWAAGSFEDNMLPLLDATFTNYAQMNDCQEITITGRLGWDPKLKSIGFKRTYQTWARPVMKVRLN